LYPDVHVELTLAQRMPDLLDEGYDVALVLATDLPDSGFVSQRLTSAFSIACASPAYLERYGVPQTPRDLVNHRCLQLVTPVFPASQWQFTGPSGLETIDLGPATFQVNVAEAMAVGVREGMGVGLLPIYSAISGLRSGELVWILPEYRSQEMTVFAMYPSRQYLDAKIRTWVEMLRETLPATLAKDQTELRRFART
ncbi:MAG TPA: substrate binding domain-containing protein, partial [Paraburkholderia sp.]|uniref:substrate binding domain-containing protein n=1 Tax=Paraburkholderia sp. TaxID=1926495 RepID=UPI002DF3F312|nr:substrate binding domain-containing protein [Paraburkholderia sp.]